jgi:hypothetical protein
VPALLEQARRRAGADFGPDGPPASSENRCRVGTYPN